MEPVPNVVEPAPVAPVEANVPAPAAEGAAPVPVVASEVAPAGDAPASAAAAPEMVAGVVEVEVAGQLNLLEPQLGLLGGDGGAQALLPVEGGFVVEAQQHLTLAHPLAVLDEHGFKHAAHRHLDGFDITDRLELAGGHHHLIGFGKGQPGQTCRRGAEQGPGDGAGQKARLLQRHLLMAGLHPPLNGVLGAAHDRHQLASCWR